MARSESLDIGTPDREALFASSEGVKWPIDSSHCSWIPSKSESGSLSSHQKKKTTSLFIKAKPPSSYLRFFFFFLNPGTFSKNAFFFLPLPSFFPG
ncbi:hypothetical protein CN402_08810 [Bacillus sp. AFS015896]|uniref:Uncharacterized protein n=1 Tax=Bacillus cereus TaxID=1396 RepID=A0A2C1LWD0_BACCE|nr:hypothetical protein CN476_25470 [Bacillus cereus]PFA62514.1 hypothetical protein CN402_08810 [Bacillus sp. AFS015896]PGU02199.1 hypothetical protein COD19_12165 [Bacillus cereus]PGX03781.1 hypothetical protein COE07_23240 [Bacillus sp. AFS033286]